MSRVADFFRDSRFRLTPAQVKKIKTEAKRRRKECRKLADTFTQSQMLAQIAIELGWRDWRHLISSAAPPLPAKCSMHFLVREDAGRIGVLVGAEVTDDRLQGVMANTKPTFMLPVMHGWRFRSLSGSIEFPLPEAEATAPRGIIRLSRWSAIVEQSADLAAEDLAMHSRSLIPLLNRLQRQIAVAILQFLDSAPMLAAKTRLLLSRPQRIGVNLLAEWDFDSVEEAKAADLPPGYQKIAIPQPKGWLVFDDRAGVWVSLERALRA